VTRLVLVSDTHLQRIENPIPDGDVLIHAGDGLLIGEMKELVQFASWMGRQRHERKLYVPGNHDWPLQRDPAMSEAWLKGAGVETLVDRSVVIDGLKYHGSPWQPEFCEWAFNLPRDGDELRARWAEIPDDTDVLITHGPPHGILDMARERCGCALLLERVEEVEPMLHVFGHIHESHGWERVGKTLFVNASTCDRLYDAGNPPIVVDIDASGAEVVE